MALQILKGPGHNWGTVISTQNTDMLATTPSHPSHWDISTSSSDESDVDGFL
jgi:hypothetical protein